MKVNGSISPPALSFEHRFDGIAEMRFRENITSKKDEKGNTIYSYDEYILTMPDRDGLEKIVTDNTAVWLAYAETQEVNQLATDVRTQRDKLLYDTDWTQVDDAPISDVDRESMRQYRQALRDITSQEGFPYNVNFPEKPQVKNVGNRSAQLDAEKQIADLQSTTDDLSFGVGLNTELVNNRLDTLENKVGG
jgi:hypothetical protein